MSGLFVDIRCVVLCSCQLVNVRAGLFVDIRCVVLCSYQLTNARAVCHG